MKEYVPDFTPMGDVVAINQSKVTSDIQIINPEARTRGIFYPDSWRSIGFAREHETLDDLISTIGFHEIIHGLIEEEKDESGIQVDPSQEHWVILQMAWAPESLVD